MPDEAMQPYPPLGTLYAASYVRSKGYSVALFDSMLAESENEWASALDQHTPKYAIIFEDNFNYLSKMCLLRMRQAAFTMIDMAKARGCAVILCGADATDHRDLYLQQGADYILLGEGEITLVELLDSLEGRSPQTLNQILGLAFKDQTSNFKFQTSNFQSPISNLQSPITNY
ncbi:MAG: radical SAM protein, partial [Chloroflexi bacterium]|nr:radical SAM protein [Chloroflexota bacterium]